MSKNSLVEINNLSVSLGNKEVLKNLSISLNKGTKAAILGPNGAGKSTLLKAIAGIIPYSGRITCHWTRCSYTAQRHEVAWNFPISCQEVVEMGLYRQIGWFRKLGKHQKDQAQAALARLGMADFADEAITDLSVGQQQRVFLARAIVDDEADFFLFDEPFAGVDLKTETKIYDIMADLAAQGKSILSVHHNLQDLAQRFDHAILLSNKLISYGRLDEVLRSKNLERAYGSGFFVPQSYRDLKISA